MYTVYSLINGLYKITPESIKLVLDVDQFGAHRTVLPFDPPTQYAINNVSRRYIVIELWLNI